MDRLIVEDEREIEINEELIAITKKQLNQYFQEQKLLRGIKTNEGKELNFKWLGDTAFSVEVAE